MTDKEKANKICKFILEDENLKIAISNINNFDPVNNPICYRVFRLIYECIKEI
jgi:hypothetical protein